MALHAGHQRLGAAHRAQPAVIGPFQQGGQGFCPMMPGIALDGLGRVLMADEHAPCVQCDHRLAQADLRPIGVHRALKLAQVAHRGMGCPAASLVPTLR
jgi:hypothetical protein